MYVTCLSERVCFITVKTFNSFRQPGACITNDTGGLCKCFAVCLGAGEDKWNDSLQVLPSHCPTVCHIVHRALVTHIPVNKPIPLYMLQTNDHQ